MPENDVYRMLSRLRRQLLLVMVAQLSFMVLAVAVLLIVREIDKSQIMAAIAVSRCHCHKGAVTQINSVKQSCLDELVYKLAQQEEEQDELHRHLQSIPNGIDGPVKQIGSSHDYAGEPECSDAGQQPSANAEGASSDAGK